jgi:2-keto-3-deoxy-L-rhamnonate aldolase RhmA/quercetin dioxygenase-like cupin family protein
MNTAAIRSFRQKLAQDQPVYGLWVTLEAPSITEMAVALGLDWVVIDAEHGHLDWKEIVEHLRVTVRSNTVALVRIAELNQGLIKRALDIGADGVVIPWVESAEQLRQAVSFSRFPPQGTRGIGAERATCWGQCFVEHTGEANENVLVVPIVETVEAVKNVRTLAPVDGVELLFFGPADLSSTAGYRGQWEGPGVAQQILAAKDTIRSFGKHCGVVSISNEDLQQRQRHGFRMLGIGLDSGLLLRSLRESLRTIGRDRTIFASFSLETAAAPPVLERPPESMRPDRMEVMNAIGSGQIVELERGVRFECLVGTHNDARNLTTGLVTFAPGSHLPYHQHTFSEAITLVSGRAVVEVEGRRYTLEPLDNVVVPPGLAHYAQNVSSTERAVFHVAMGTDAPTRTLVSKYFSRRAMPADAAGQPGAERVNRIKLVKRGSAGPNTVFIDYFNQDLMPGIEMSGGYGLFQTGGRLPAHVHDFDESICIIQGRATCVVEGRRYAMSDCATALQPRGRVHYFINEAREPMAMIWVYAGPVPQRIVVDEKCATTEGNPWR